MSERGRSAHVRYISGTTGATGFFAGSSSVFLLAGLNANAPAASVSALLCPANSVIAGRALFCDAVSRSRLVGLVTQVTGMSAIVVG